MYVPTEKTQRKLQQLVHERFCHAACDGEWNSGGQCQVISAFMLGRLMPEIAKEMFPAVRRDMRQQIHDTIVGELVCCDLYEKMNDACADPELAHMHPTQLASHLGLRYHSICHWGGYAASLAINECPSGGRTCEPSYWCPTSGEWESPCHGGFDVCCSHPERHVTGPGAATPGV